MQSPYSAVARAVLIDVAWEQVHDQARKWEQEQGDHPSICTVLAVHYDNAGDAEKSDIYLRKLITIAPEKWAYEMLAWHEFARGNQNSGAAIMNAFLEKSHGLERAQGQVDLANYYISKKEFHKAARVGRRCGDKLCRLGDVMRAGALMKATAITRRRKNGSRLRRIAIRFHSHGISGVSGRVAATLPSARGCQRWRRNQRAARRTCCPQRRLYLLSAGRSNRRRPGNSRSHLR